MNIFLQNFVFGNWLKNFLLFYNTLELQHKLHYLSIKGIAIRENIELLRFWTFYSFYWPWTRWLHLNSRNGEVCPATLWFQLSLVVAFLLRILLSYHSYFAHPFLVLHKDPKCWWTFLFSLDSKIRTIKSWIEWVEWVRAQIGKEMIIIPQIWRYINSIR